MKALRINDYGAPLHIDEVAVPSPASGQVLVENDYTSMNGVDPGRGQGFLRQVFPLQFPWTPGGDVAGRVAAVGVAGGDGVNLLRFLRLLRRR